ncbi:MAG: hypothetical protein WBO70_00730, partial [Erysipelotrichaceae bacterium]
ENSVQPESVTVENSVQPEAVVVEDNAQSEEIVENSNLKQAVIIDGSANEKYLEETKQLRLKLDDYKEELQGVGNNVSYSNRILNFVLVILIIGLVLVLCFVVYWILLARGILS